MSHLSHPVTLNPNLTLTIGCTSISWQKPESFQLTTSALIRCRCDSPWYTIQTVALFSHDLSVRTWALIWVDKATISTTLILIHWPRIEHSFRLGPVISSHSYFQHCLRIFWSMWISIMFYRIVCFGPCAAVVRLPRRKGHIWRWTWGKAIFPRTRALHISWVFTRVCLSLILRSACCFGSCTLRSLWSW